METKRNHLEALLFTLFLASYPLYMIIAHFTVSNIIFMFYIIIMIFQLYILYLYRPSKKQLLILVGLYMLYGMLFIMSDERIRMQFISVKMIMNYGYYLPLAVLIFSRMKDFSFIFEHPKIALLTDSLIIVAFISKYLLNNQVNYMTYSYNLLPFWILLMERFVRKQNLRHYVMLFICLLEGVMYGSRGALLMLLVAGIMFTLVHLIQEKQRLYQYFVAFSKLVVVIGVYFLLIQRLSIWLNSFDAETSYILRRVNRNIITESYGRSDIYKTFIDYLPTMGIGIKGLFYDRLIMLNGMYSHNFMIETMISFGWLLGPFLLMILAALAGYSFFTSDYQGKKVWLFFTCTYFLKYFISGSIYDDYGFLLYVAVLVSLVMRARHQKRIIV